MDSNGLTFGKLNVASRRYQLSRQKAKYIRKRLRVVTGKICEACGQNQRRSPDLVCIHCLWWRAMNCMENPSRYSKNQQRNYLDDLVMINAYDRARQSARRGSNMRRGRMRNAPGGFTRRQALVILDAQSGHCAYCSERNGLHLDHCIPLSRGGSNWPWNLQWLCAPHNLSKGSATDAEYREQIGLPPDLWVSLRLWSAALVLDPQVLSQT